MSKKWSDFVQKQRPQPNFQSTNQSQEFEPLASYSANRTKPQDIEQQQPTGIQGQIERARSFVLGRQEPEPQGWLSIFNCLSNEKSYTRAAISIFVSALMLFVSALMLPTIVLVPAKFVMFFTFSMIGLILAMAFFNGPRLYIKRLFLQKNLYASGFLILSILLALWFSLIQSSYILSLVFCVCELNAVLFYFCNTKAVSLAQITWMCRTCGAYIRSKF